MNIALLTAGGKGTRMNKSVPKQFLKINGKPLLVYTIESFQNCEEIDSIIVVVIEGWEKEVLKYKKEYKLNKIKYIVEGGSTGQESIYNGFKKAQENYDEDAIVIIHDGNRPLITSEIIKKAILTCKEKGNAVGYIPCQEVILVSDNMKTSNTQIDRSKLARTQTPHVYFLKDLNKIFKKAKEMNLNNCVAVCSICALLGIESNLYLGSEKNIKITTPEDIEIFKAIYNNKNI